MTAIRPTLACAIVLFPLLAGCSGTTPAPIHEYVKNRTAGVFVFLSTDCPISQNYTRTLKNLRAQFQDQRIEFYAIFPGETDASDFIATYGIPFPVLPDRNFELADYFGATTTPEAFVVDRTGRTAYSGAIDNWTPELGQRRTVITEHYVRDALNSIIQSAGIRVKHTQAVGCFIERPARS